MGPGRDPHVGAATESTCSALGSLAPSLVMLRIGQVLDKAHLNKEHCLTQLSQTMLHLTTRELWPVSLGLLAPVAVGSWCRQSPAGAGAGRGVLPAVVVHLGPCPSHAPRSAGLSGDVVAAHQPVLLELLLAGRHRSNSWLGRRYLAPLVLEKKLGAGRAGPGGGSRAESSSVTQVGQEHFIKVLSLPLASGDLWGAAVRDVATGEVQVSSPSHPASPCGCQAGV